MPGGLLNLVAEGNANRVLTGNPTKTMFKTTYAKHTNFGLQKFRLEYSGQRSLLLDSSSVFDFKVPRHGDLLMDTYLVITLPTIWSTVHPPNDSATTWRPYEFQWIRQIGSQLIKRVSFTIGGITIQEYSGDYMAQVVERDFDSAKKTLYQKMTGDVEELYNPKSCFDGLYPNVEYLDTAEPPEPSIRSRKLYIPVNCWFSMASEMAFPLTSLDYNELHIEFELRPIKEIFTILRIPQTDDETNERKSPNFNDPTEQFYRFIQAPPSYSLESSDYQDTRTNWNADIHLISTYAFLSEEENKVFQQNTQTYLLRQVKTYTFPNIVTATKLQLDTHGMVSSWMWNLRRDDCGDRNEWNNYSNWPYLDQRPYGLELLSENTDTTYLARLMDTSGSLLQQLGQFDEAETLFRRALDSREKELGPGHTDTAETLNNLAEVLRDNGDLDGAEALFRRASVIYEEKLGVDHPNTRNVAKNLASLLDDVERNEEADEPPATPTTTNDPPPTHTTTDERSEDNDDTEGNIDTSNNAAEMGQAESLKVLTELVANISLASHTPPSPLHNNDIFVTGRYKADNEKQILLTAGFVFDGKMRETTLDSGVYEYAEKYARTSGNAPDGVYCYNCGIRTDPFDTQPTGAINTTHFKKVEFEITVMNPPLDPNATVTTICDDDGNIIGIKKMPWDIYLYSYDMTVYEERYNILTIEGGYASMLFS